MKTTDTILDKIVADKKSELATRKRHKPIGRIEDKLTGLELPEEPGLYEVLKAAAPNPKIIAEVKKASPSAGILRDPFDLGEINDAYQAADSVVAISVITETKYFQGSEDFLKFFAAHNTHKKPLLRKDFIFDTYQILESKLLGAQAYLLIASLFDEKELAELVNYGLKIGLEPLVEVHTQEELDMALATKARCIGANARDLKTFEVDLSRHELLKQLDDSYARVAESGIDDIGYLKRVSKFSDAALIGTEFMKAKDVTSAVRMLEVLA